ncbi:MAG: sigma-70 family RNA polymerase sigma factor [Candidimonas sp.]|nr:MAG: sigma-70 family RNA polymerase sigma factor [Candidimonas sp.]TAM26955.1 MAG: sigma-70 family RNA polymerase sigma factor [Candidimonas sp.]TAM76346.1 MAG: sigma-70 family RNA polymerase sigma factor [Candidimonas sp.]
MSVSHFDYEAKLADCAQTNYKALEDLFHKEAPRMLALAVKMLSQRDDAEDIVRDSFVLIWKNSANYDPKIGTARAWMYSIMRYRILNRLRQSGRHTATEADWIDNLPDGAAAGPGASVSSSLPQRLAALGDAQRRPILMAFYNGFTYDQIAARLAVPATQIREQVRAGLSTLAQGEAA